MSYRGRGSIPGLSSVQRGTQLSGIYHIDSLIAAGGMGEVYLGHNIQTGDPVAIKIVLPEFAEDEMILELLRKEARILFHLAHDAIVRYYVFTIDPVLGRAYLAMEYVDGPSLAQRLPSGPLSLAEAIILKTRLADGLHKAHEAGVIHRDVSPDNIILPENSVERAKIIDFSIARTTKIGGGTILGGSFAGKYNFVSPEQLGMFGGDVTARSDIYSLGLVLAAALRGVPLDMAGSQVEVIEKRRQVPSLEGIEAPIHDLLRAMLNPNPAGRLASMAQVRDWTVDVARQEPRPLKALTEPLPRTAEARPVRSAARPPAVQPASVPSRNVALPATLAVAVTIAAAVFGGWYYVEYQSPPAAPPPDISKPKETEPGPVKPDTSTVPPAPVPPAPVPPEPVAAGAAKIASFIRDYQDGACFFADPRSVSDSGAELAIYSLSEDAARKFHGAFTAALGVEPKSAVHLVSDKQCPVVNAARVLSKGARPAPDISLEKQKLSFSDRPAGQVKSAPQGFLYLLLVDHAGFISNASSKLKGANGQHAFSVPLTLPKDPAVLAKLANRSQLALIVSSARPIDVSSPSIRSPNFIQMLMEQNDVSVGLGYFKFDGGAG